MGKIYWDALEFLPNPLFTYFFLLYYNLGVIQQDAVIVVISDY